MLKIALTILGAVVVLAAAVVVVGYLLPKAHVAEREVDFAKPPDQVFAVLRDVDRYATWRSDLQAVEVLSREPVTRWREQGRDGTITFEMAEAAAPQRMVTRIADRSLPFGGTWTFVLRQDGNRTRLTITENGEVYNPVFRFMARFVFGHTATLDRFLGDLGKHLLTPDS